MARYHNQIDWLSIVLPVVPLGEGSELSHNSVQIERAIHNEIGEGIADRIFSRLHVLDYGRAPYSFGWRDDQKGVTIWAGGASPHFCIEFSGTGVHYLRENFLLKPVLEGFSNFLSRIDVAIDLDVDTSPSEFVSFSHGRKQTTRADMSSPSGNTVYIGSMHSERYMRVYRYAPPHPRSHLLRVEMVARRAYAKQAGNQILEVGLDAVAQAMLEAFGFQPEIAGFKGIESAELSVFRPERNMGKTLRWLITSCAPAFKRLVQAGTIPDARQFLESYFLSDLDEREPTE